MKVPGNLYTVPSSFLNMRLAIFLLVLISIIGVLGFRMIESYSWLDSAYMTVITISTVGYGEVRALSEEGRVFASIFIAINFGILSYILAVFSYNITQGDIFKRMHLNMIRKNIGQISDHVIVCGFGRYGREAVAHLKSSNIEFVIIDVNEKKIQAIQENSERALYVEGDATHDEVLIEAGIDRARAVICALPDDSDNVFVVLSARQLNPMVPIISRANNPKTEKKLRLAGANHVVLPDQIGGFYMATLVTKPGAIDFFSLITNEYRSDIGFEIIEYKDLPKDYQGKNIREVPLRQVTGTNIIGYQDPNGQYFVNPGPETLLAPGSSFDCLGKPTAAQSIKWLFELEQIEI